MRRVKFLTMAAACLSLTACGGGGGTSSTPAPPPTPPAPTPTQTNSSLTNLQFSESFTNDAASGSGTYALDGSSVTIGVASSEALTVSYNPTNSSYSISAPGRSQTFRSSDRVQPADPNVVSYEVKSGATTSELVMSRPGDDTLRYVGAAFWSRSQNSGNQVSTTVDAFSFGVETPDAALPRSGSARYAIGISGFVASVDAIVGLAGSGQLDADFMLGRLTISGDSYEVDDLGGRARGREFSGAAQIANATNSFSGNLTFEDRSGAFIGTLNGRLYGPQAEEIGGTFYANRKYPSGEQEREIVGTIIGLQSTSSPSGAQFSRAAHLSYGRDQNSGSVVGPISAEADVSFLYQPGTGQWKLSSIKGQSTTVVESLSQALVNVNGAPITRYQYDQDTPSSTTFDQYNGQSRNGIVLTYSGFGLWSVLYYQFNRQPVDVFPFVYGTVTPSSALPRSGSASYTGFVYGAGLGTGSAHAQYELQGDANANFDLATAAFTGTIRPSVTKVDFASGARTAVALGDLSLSGGVAPSRSEFHGNIAYGGGNVGNLIGNFFGPNAEEIGATMKFDLGTNAGLPEATAFVGTLSGKKN